MELLITVLRHGFMVVATLTKCLPVCFIPEQLCIPSVRDDVVNHGRFHQSPLLHALHAERMCFQETCPCFLPPAIISPDGCTGSVGGVQLCVFGAVHHLCQLRASGMFTWLHRFPRHGCTPPSCFIPPAAFRTAPCRSVPASRPTFYIPPPQPLAAPQGCAYGTAARSCPASR